MTAQDLLYFDWLHSGLSLFWSELDWLQICYWLNSDLNGLLYNISVYKEMFADHSYPWKYVLWRVSFQESICTETCLSTRFLAMDLYVIVG
jgi:hypothetical protein